MGKKALADRNLYLAIDGQLKKQSVYQQMPYGQQRGYYYQPYDQNYQPYQR